MIRQAFVDDKGIYNELIPKIREHKEPLFGSHEKLLETAEDIKKNYKTYFEDKGKKKISQQAEADMWTALREEYTALGGTKPFPEIDPGLQGFSIGDIFR